MRLHLLLRSLLTRRPAAAIPARQPLPDWRAVVYGVTMEEPGVSTIVGVELEGAWSFGADQRVA